MKLTKEFLESKLAYYECNEYGTVLHRSSSGNIEVISDNIFSFTQYNFRAGTDGQLDGHYTFYVNVTNFNYLLYKFANYGGLTYVTESDNKNWITNLIERERIKVESIIAHKILGAYYHDKTNFIEDSFSRGSLITDYRGMIWTGLKPDQRKDNDIKAIKILEPEYKLREVKSYKLGKITEKVRSKEDHGKYTLNRIQYLLPINITYTDKTKDVIYFCRELTGLYYKNYIFLDKDRKPLSKYSDHYAGKPSNIIKMIPDFMKSL